MYDTASPSSSTPAVPLFHPKPVRPVFSSSYSSPVLPTHPHPSGATSPPTAPSSTACSPSPPHPGHSGLGKSNSLGSKHRAKMPKKISSTSNKHKSVQVSLEVKVERSRGFHAFFVPLARSMPPAPPSSPVLGQSSNPPPASEYPKGQERWVEDVNVRMDID